MSDEAISPEAAKVLAARRSAVEELRALDGKVRPIGDHDVARVAAARLLCDSLIMRMVSGDPIGPSDLKHASEMVDAALTDAGKKQIEVKLEIARTLTGVCPNCQHEVPDIAPTPSKEELLAQLNEAPWLHAGALEVVATPVAEPPTENNAPRIAAKAPEGNPYVRKSSLNGQGSLCWYGSRQ
jgi:hypothetical protein